jgi:acetyltransferase-like isoleucine patch superfamily enzyme
VEPSLAQSGGCYIQGANGLEIGAGTIIAPGVKIITANHSFADFQQWVVAEPIRIGRNCWIGVNAVILPGVQLGDRVIVGAGSVVTKSIPSNCVIAGVPARTLRSLET